MTDRNQPLIIDQANSNDQYVAETDPVTQGVPYIPKNQNQNPYQNQPYCNDQPPYQGQPPVNYNQDMPPPPPAIPPQLRSHPQIVLIEQQLLITCPICGYVGSYARKSPGCATFSWCVCLFCFTGIFCFWVPFAIDRCWDVEVVCSRCNYVKAIIEANCV